jgi:hypothetical protein
MMVASRLLNGVCRERGGGGGRITPHDSEHTKVFAHACDSGGGGVGIDEGIKEGASPGATEEGTDCCSQ